MWLAIDGFIGTIFRTREYGECLFSFLSLDCSQWLHGYDFSYPRVWGGCLFPFFVCGLLNGFTGAIFRTHAYERWFVHFWGCGLPDGFTGTIFRTREYGECLFSFLSLSCSQWLYRYDFSYPRIWGGGLFIFGGVGCPMVSRVRFFVPASMGRALVSFSLGWVSSMASRVRFFVPASARRVLVSLSGLVLFPLASWVRFFVPASMWKCWGVWGRGAV